MSQKSPPESPGLPFVMTPADATGHANAKREHEERIAKAGTRDQIPTQGPGCAAGEVGDRASLSAFVSGAPLVDGVATQTPAPQAGDAAPAPAPARPEDGPGPLNNQGQRVPVSFDPQNADEMYRYAQMLARSSLLPRAFYDRDDKEKKHARVGDVHFVLMKGRALGLHPMTAIGNINIIDGKAEVGALLMLSMVRKSGLMAPGGWRLVHSDTTRAVFATRRIDEDWTEFEYTIEEADQMGLLDKGRSEWAQANNQWKKQPRTMLRRRAQSMLLREVYPDVVLGCYDHDELTEMRERERALGIDPDRVIPATGAARPALAERSSPDVFEFARAAAAGVQADPLKARLADRRSAAAAVARCSVCDTELDPRDSDPCIACRPEPGA